MFSSHGDFSVELRGSILFISMYGGWNVETALGFKKAVEEATKPVKSTQWAALTCMSKWELCTPDCEPIIVEFSVKAKRDGLTREAVVNSSNVSQIKLSLFEKYRDEALVMQANPEFVREFFQDKKPALNWLIDEGYKAT